MPINIGRDIETERATALVVIDEAAGKARARFVSPGAYIDVEYEQAAQAVKDWRAAGSPAEDVPDEIRSGALYSDITNEQAAQEIETTALIYAEGLRQARNIRLTHKRAARIATTRAEIASARRAAEVASDAVTLASVTATVLS